MSDSTAEHDRHWPVWIIVLLGWLLPATAARRSQHLSLKWALVIHLALLPFAFCSFFAAAYATLEPRLGGYIAKFFHEMADLLFEEMWEDFDLMLMFIVPAEAAIFLGALILASWGAVDEPFRKSFKQTLRQIWLRTPHVLIAVFVASLFMHHFIQAERQWQADVERQVELRMGITKPEPPRLITAGSPEVIEYNKAFSEWFT